MNFKDFLEKKYIEQIWKDSSLKNLAKQIMNELWSSLAEYDWSWNKEEWIPMGGTELIEYVNNVALSIISSW